MASIRKREWKTATGEPRRGWEVVYFDRKGQRNRRQFTKRYEAEAFRTEIESQLRANTYRREAAKVTVADAAELFLQHCRERMERREPYDARQLPGL
jgi:hypothetical protein